MYQIAFAREQLITPKALVEQPVQFQNILRNTNLFSDSQYFLSAYLSAALYDGLRECVLLFVLSPNPISRSYFSYEFVGSIYFYRVHTFVLAMKIVSCKKNLALGDSVNFKSRLQKLWSNIRIKLKKLYCTKSHSEFNMIFTVHQNMLPSKQFIVFYEVFNSNEFQVGTKTQEYIGWNVDDK